MPSIYIETFPIGWNKFQLIQSGRLVLGNRGYDFSDWIETYESKERMLAAIINFGLAARYLVDEFEGWNGNEIAIATDIDGLDTKFGGEHDVLYALFNPHSDYEARKLQGLYAQYDKYLIRAKLLVEQGKIGVKLQ